MTPALVKYFHEAPVHLEALSAETAPDARRRDEPAMPLAALLTPANYYRGYLAGSHGDRVGLTAIPDPAAFPGPRLAVFGGLAWRGAREEEVTEVSDLDAVLRDPSGVQALAGGAAGEADLRAVAAVERRYAVPALTRLLDGGAVVLFPEQAHDGFDWSLFSATPVKDRLVAALRAHPGDGVRRFVMPYRRARSEHKFYFDRWTLDALPEWVEEL